MTKAIAPARKRYDPAEIDAALTVLAASGSSLRASELTGIPSSTLRDWKTEHARRYAEIQEHEAPKLEAIAANQAREIMIRAGEVEHSLLDVLNDRLSAEEAPEPARDDFPNEALYLLAYEQWLKRGSSKELSELAGTLQRVTTAKGINGTKLLELTGRPTQIVEHRDPGDTVNALARRLGIVLDATATEIPPTQALPPASVIANRREPSTDSPEPNPAVD